MTTENEMFNDYKSTKYSTQVLLDQDKLFSELRRELDSNIYNREMGEATLLVLDIQIERCKGRTTVKALEMIKDLIKYKMEDLV
tara:strand:+ start:1015 stop:1266 length:252 start_codon:yes stop_codon:yes gene_type:complete